MIVTNGTSSQVDALRWRRPDLPQPEASTPTTYNQIDAGPRQRHGRRHHGRLVRRVHQVRSRPGCRHVRRRSGAGHRPRRHRSGASGRGRAARARTSTKDVVIGTGDGDRTPSTQRRRSVGADHDVVDLGAGDDALFLGSVAAGSPTPPFDGGAGEDPFTRFDVGSSSARSPSTSGPDPSPSAAAWRPGPPSRPPFGTIDVPLSGSSALRPARRSSLPRHAGRSTRPQRRCDSLVIAMHHVPRPRRPAARKAH